MQCTDENLSHLNRLFQKLSWFPTARERTISTRSRSTLPGMMTIWFLGVHGHEVLAVEGCSFSDLGGPREGAGWSTGFGWIRVWDLHTSTAALICAVTSKTIALGLEAAAKTKATDTYQRELFTSFVTFMKAALVHLVLFLQFGNFRWILMFKQKINTCYLQV